MKTILSMVFHITICGVCLAEPVVFPAKAGEYVHKGWKYVYEVKFEGTRSERRIGRLFLNGKEIKGSIGELHQEPLGVFIYFGEGGHNQGWLNTMTYGATVFTKDGSPTPEVMKLLNVLRETKTKVEQDAALKEQGDNG